MSKDQYSAKAIVQVIKQLNPSELAEIKKLIEEREAQFRREGLSILTK